MTTRPRMDFGYNPPSGDRDLETIRRREYVADLNGALDVASKAFSSLWVSDHLAYGDKHRIECWTLLTWIAARYPDLDLSTIVMCNTFRNPALLAKMAGSLQELSSGHFTLGYGAGWHKDQHISYGYDFPTALTRIEMMEEAIQVIRALWTEAPANFSGKHYHLKNAFGEPRPEPIPPIMIGGAGKRYTLRAVARHADWWNDVHRSPERLRRELEVLKSHCGNESRDYASIRKTLTARVFIHPSHTTALEMAGDRLQSTEPPMAGDPTAVRDQITELAEMGFDLFIACFPGFQDLDDMKLFMNEVMPEFA